MTSHVAAIRYTTTDLGSSAGATSQPGEHAHMHWLCLHLALPCFPELGVKTCALTTKDLATA